ncbi:MAG TPA: BON domain-containing protein [Burkholderiales bacterium]
MPLVVGGVAAGAIAVTDRRSVGTQADDKAIGFKVDRAIDQVYHDRAHVNINPYNRRVLLTGEVPDERAKADVARIAAGVENVRDVVNEVQVGMNSTIANRSNDAVITSIVKGNMVDDSDVPAAAVKVTTEANVVYLQGLVTQQEGDAAAAAAARSRGVSQVVKVFEYIAAPPAQGQPAAK